MLPPLPLFLTHNLIEGHRYISRYMDIFRFVLNFLNYNKDGWPRIKINELKWKRRIYYTKVEKKFSSKELKNRKIVKYSHLMDEKSFERKLNWSKCSMKLLKSCFFFFLKLLNRHCTNFSEKYTRIRNDNNRPLTSVLLKWPMPRPQSVFDRFEWNFACFSF